MPSPAPDSPQLSPSAARTYQPGGGIAALSGRTRPKPAFTHGRASYYNEDCLEWLRRRRANSIHGVVTDPPYGLVEFSRKENEKRISGKGGVWRQPPSFDGHTRAPLPRFTTLSQADLENLFAFFHDWAQLLRRTLVPGAHVLVASNPLVSHVLSAAIQTAGYERRGEIIRLVQTLRGGDRPKNAHEEFADVTVMPRSQHEPWVLFRKPLIGTVQENLRRWKTGALRRVSDEKPFGDVISSHPTRASERNLAPHPNLKPQSFLRQVVRAILPLGQGAVLDPFAGSGSTLAAAEAIDYRSIGVELDPSYIELAQTAVPALKALEIKSS